MILMVLSLFMDSCLSFRLLLLLWSSIVFMLYRCILSDAYYLFVCIYLSVTLYCNLMMLYLVFVTGAPTEQEFDNYCNWLPFSHPKMWSGSDWISWAWHDSQLRYAQRTIACINEWMHVYIYKVSDIQPITILQKEFVQFSISYLYTIRMHLLQIYADHIYVVSCNHVSYVSYTINLLLVKNPSRKKKSIQNSPNNIIVVMFFTVICR